MPSLAILQGCTDGPPTDDAWGVAGSGATAMATHSQTAAGAQATAAHKSPTAAVSGHGKPAKSTAGHTSGTNASPASLDDSDAGITDAAAPSMSADAQPTPATDGGTQQPDTTQPTDNGLGSKPPFMPTGMPIMAPKHTWTWVPFDDTHCRSGSTAGLSVNLHPNSKRIMIYLEGGGACFDAQTCAANPDAVSSQHPGDSGVFDRDRDENPVKDWNYVYVPYCTGDVHMGAQKDGTVDGVDGRQQFVGRLNLTAFLQRIVPTFADAEQVLLTGISAGGFGAASNAAYVQWAFGDIPVTTVDDSGPTFSRQYLPKCLTETYVKTWGLSGSILDDCGSACSAKADYSVQFLEYTLARAQGRSSGLIESDQDSVIRGFFGIGTDNGANDCMGVLLLTSMSADDFLAGLLDYRERVKDYPNMSTFYPSSTQHTWLGGDSFYTSKAGDVSLVDWFSNVLEGKPGIHAGH